MGILSVKVKKLNPNSLLPTYAKQGDAGMDLILFLKNNGGNKYEY